MQKRLGDGVIQDKMIVLDASVVVKWFSEEEYTDKALEINSAVTLAFEHNITVYDAFYLALAKEIEFTFITADKKLYERVRDLNFVKFIGDIE